MTVFTKSHTTRRPVPEVPRKITGPCMYGHILTEEHKAHFRRLHPDIPEWKTSDFDDLVCVASTTIPGCHTVYTAEVHDDQGEGQVCLVLVGYRNRSRLRDLRWEDGLMTDLENSLGITGEPNWYRCRFLSSSDR